MRRTRDAPNGFPGRPHRADGLGAAGVVLAPWDVPRTPEEALSGEPGVVEIGTDLIGNPAA